MLKLEGISKQFSSTQACSDISLEIQSNEFFSLLGSSGCGKTTLLKIISGLIAADRGSLFLDDQCLDSIPAHKRNINTVFQNYALFPHLNVFDNVAFGLRMKGNRPEEIRKKVTEMLKLVELERFEHRTPNQLSGGQQQRVALARAVVNHPQVLLLDEPLAALDVKLRKQMQLELRHLQKTLGMTFIYVTHDQEEALLMSDRIAVMNNGRIEQLGVPEEIYGQPRTRFVAGFLGESNFFEGENFRVDGATLHLQIGNAEVILGICCNGLLPGTRVTLAVRPERISINPNSIHSDVGLNRVTATVAEVIYLGTIHHVIARLANGQAIKVLRQFSGNEPPRVGDRVHLEWNVKDTIVIPE